jgi:hypothetical protein
MRSAVGVSYFTAAPNVKCTFNPQRRAYIDQLSPTPQRTKTKETFGGGLFDCSTELFFVGWLAGNVNDCPKWRGNPETDPLLDIALWQLATMKHHGNVDHAEVSRYGQVNAARFKLTNPMHCQRRLVRYNRFPSRPQSPHRELIMYTRHPISEPKHATLHANPITGLNMMRLCLIRVSKTLRLSSRKIASLLRSQPKQCSSQIGSVYCHVRHHTT